MAPRCTVCQHNERAAIDLMLASPSTNVEALARQHGLKPDALRRHRGAHLPTFMELFVHRSEVPTEQELAYELKRLYAAALDSLAAAQAGVLTKVDDDGTEHRRISVSAVSAAINTARAVAGDLAKVAAREGGIVKPPTDGGGEVLAGRVLAALERVAGMGAGRDDVVDAEVIEADGDGAGGTVGPGPGSGGPVDGTGVGPTFSETPPETHSPPNQSTSDAGGPPVSYPGEVEGSPAREDRWALQRWEALGGNPAATADERRAVGYVEPPPAGTPPAPPVEADPRDALRP